MSQVEKNIEGKMYEETLNVFKSVSYDDILFQQAYLNEVKSALSPYTNEDRRKAKIDIKGSDRSYYNKINYLFKLRAGITYEETRFSESKKQILTISSRNLKTPSLENGIKFRIKAFNVSCVNTDLSEKQALIFFKHEFKSGNPTLSYGMKKARKILKQSKYFEGISENSYVPTEVDLTIDIDFKAASMTLNGIPYEECYTDTTLSKIMKYISTDHSSILRTIFPYGLESAYYDIMDKLPNKVDVFNKLYSMVVYISNKEYFRKQNYDTTSYSDYSYGHIFEKFKERYKDKKRWENVVKAIENDKLKDILDPKYKRAFYLSTIENKHKSVFGCFNDLKSLIDFVKNVRPLSSTSENKNEQKNVNKPIPKKINYRKNFILPMFPKIVKNRSDLITYLNEERFTDFTQIRNNLYRPSLECVMNGIKNGLELIPTNLRDYEKYINTVSYKGSFFNKGYEGNDTNSGTALNLVEGSVLIGSKNMADIVYHYLYRDKNILESSRDDNYQIKSYLGKIIDIFSNYRFRKDNEYYLEENIKMAPYNTYADYSLDDIIVDDYRKNKLILNELSYYYFEMRNLSYEKFYNHLCEFNSKYIRSLIDSDNWPNMEPILATFGFREDRKKLDPKFIQITPKLNISSEYITEYPVKKESELDIKNKLYPKFIDVFDKKSNKYIGSIYLRTTNIDGYMGEASSSIFFRSEYKYHSWSGRLDNYQKPLYLYRFGNKPASDIISKYVYNNDIQFTITYNKPERLSMLEGKSGEFYYQIRANDIFDEYLPSAYSNIDSFYFVQENGKLVSVKSQSYRDFDKFSEVKLTNIFPKVYKDLIESQIINIKREI